MTVGMMNPQIRRLLWMNVHNVVRVADMQNRVTATINLNRHHKAAQRRIVIGLV